MAPMLIRFDGALAPNTDDGTITGAAITAAVAETVCFRNFLRVFTGESVGLEIKFWKVAFDTAYAVWFLAVPFLPAFDVNGGALSF
jgi:hypothetical protein